MPTLHSVPFRTEVHAISLIDSAKQSIRTVASAVGVAKSTLHDNLGRYRADIAAFESWKSNSERDFVKFVLKLTFDGKTSTRDCANIMSSLIGRSVTHQSVLDVLKSAANVAAVKNEEKFLPKVVDEAGAGAVAIAPMSQVTCAAFDEIFQNRYPILGFADPISSFIFLEAADDRSEKSWTEFLRKLESLGLAPATTVTDGGQGMLKGIDQTFPQAIQIRDLFHVLQKLSKALRVLEGRCYGLIAAVDKARKRAELESLAALEEKMNKAILLYDALEKEVKMLQRGFYFENSDGYVNAASTKLIIDRIVALISCVERSDIHHDAIKAARTYLSGAAPHIIAYKATIEHIVAQRFGAIHSNTILGYICPLIEMMDQIQRSYENRERRAYWTAKLIEARQSFRQFAFIDQSEVDVVINEVAKVMGRIRKSSSLIEAVNSVIRRHLVTYKSIPSWFCPLFTFYWNHRRFRRGKPRNLKPCEILTGRISEEDWIEALLADYPFAKIGTSKESSAIVADAA